MVFQGSQKYPQAWCDMLLFCTTINNKKLFQKIQKNEIWFFEKATHYISISDFGGKVCKFF